MSIELHGPAWAWALVVFAWVVLHPIVEAAGREAYRAVRARR